ncbi:MAG: AgmX/PglI C-terminal domain-containing protein [Polyangiales bacterium]
MRHPWLPLLAVGCASQAAPPPRAPDPPPPPRVAAVDAGAPRCGSSGGITIEGQLGTIAQANVRRVLRDAEETLHGCYTARLGDLPWLGGRVALRIRVGEDGAVRWAVPTESTMGDRETERCLIDRARALRFDAPCGGEAEVTWSMEGDAGPDARPPVELPPSRFAATLRQRRAALTACRAGDTSPLQVYVTVAPDGSVAAAGAGAASPEALERTDCVVREVRGWRLPSPGSWYARAVVSIP